MSADYGLVFADFPQHAQMLAASGITPEHARARGYVSVDTKARLEQLGITKAGRNVPGLLIPQLRKDGSTSGFQYRPDNPRLRDGKPVKYETPTGQLNSLDVPPGVGNLLDDPAVTLWVTEGVKKADAAALAGLCCVDLPGVWSWRGKNPHGGKMAIPDWHDVALNGRRVILAFDSDVVRKREVRRALDALAGYLGSKGAKVEYLHLPDDDTAKTGLDDYLAAGHTAPDLMQFVKPNPPALGEITLEPERSAAPVTELPTPMRPRTLADTHAVFLRWLGADYDLDALDAVLAVASAERLPGDPAWLLMVSGSGAAKTETVSPLAGAGAHVTSTITSEGALLSGTSTKERTKNSTGGLLRKIGPYGLLVIKDVTSILSMGREARASVLAALREVYDGKWERNVGTDGGRTLTWTGRLGVIGAVTTAWDSAHSVVSIMGDRFVLVRLDSKIGRVRSGRQAIHNTGDEDAMRAELSEVVGGLLSTVDASADYDLTSTEVEHLLGLADVVTLARTAVETDPRGQVLDAHAPEMPTRFAKQLTQVVRGGLALGMTHDHALRIASRCARDSVPPLRLAVLLDLNTSPYSTTHAVRRRLDRPRTTIDRVLQSLHMLQLVTVDEVVEGHKDGERSVWHYSIHPDISPDAIRAIGSSGSVTPSTQEQQEEGREHTPAPAPPPTPPDTSGTTPVGSNGTRPGRSLSHSATCVCCGWPVDSNGHHANCEAAS